MSQAKKKLGFVVGPGSMKCLASLPFWDFFKSEGIAVDFTAGASGGALINAMIAMGRSSAEVIESTRRHCLLPGIFSTLNYSAIFDIARLPVSIDYPQMGLVKADVYHEVMHATYGDILIEDLPTAQAIQATDFVTGQGVIFSRGSLWKALTASATMFPLLPPFFHEDRWLVDGVYSSSLPVIEAVRANMDVIISINLVTTSQSEPKDFTTYLETIVGKTSSNNLPFQAEVCKYLHSGTILQIDIPFERHIPIYSDEALPYVMAQGKAALEKNREAILRVLS